MVTDSVAAETACFVCGAGEDQTELRVRKFEILYYEMEAKICRDCCELSLADDCGEKSEPWDMDGASA